MKNIIKSDSKLIKIRFKIYLNQVQNLFDIEF